MSDLTDRLQALKGNLSTSEFARRLGMRQPTLHNYMQGRSPSVEFIRAVCIRCNVSADWLLGLSDAQTGGPPPGVPEPAAGNGKRDCRDCPLMQAAMTAVGKRQNGKRDGPS